MGAPTTRSSSSKTPKRGRWLSPRRYVSAFGVPGLLCLLALGWHLPTTRPPVSASQLPVSAEQRALPTLAFSQPISEAGEGGAPAAQTFHPSQPKATADVCFPTDTNCWMQSVAQWVAQQILNALQPLVSGLLNNSVDILYQTPAADTYQNATVISLWNVLMDAVTVALACLIVIGGYNVIIAPYLGLRQSSMGAFLPRLLLAFGAAHFSLSFLGIFIELENTLCKAILQTAGLNTLTNIILGLVQNSINEGTLLWILVIVMSILVICLAGQMVVRIGMVVLLIVLAAPALLCLALPQTQRYGRLWMTLFASSVLVQFFQVLALTLGGMLLTSVGATNILNLPQGIAQAFLCIGVLYLVLKIPGMLNNWALHPMQEAGEAFTSGGSGGGGAAQGYVQDQAGRQAAIDAMAVMI